MNDFNLSANVSGNSLTLTWSNNTIITSGYKVYVALYSTGPWTLLATVGKDVFTYTRPNNTPGTRFFKVDTNTFIPNTQNKYSSNIEMINNGVALTVKSDSFPEATNTAYPVVLNRSGWNYSWATYTGPLPNVWLLQVSEDGIEWNGCSYASVDGDILEITEGFISPGTYVSVIGAEADVIPPVYTTPRSNAVIAPATMPCFVEGTEIMLSSGESKNVEDLDYNDLLLVWNFDQGNLDVSKPLWIKVPQTTDAGYNVITFSDGTVLKTLQADKGHRIFSKEEGKFVYPMVCPIGTTTVNVEGEEVTLVSREIIHEEVTFYNIITDHHINVFANGILTSCRFNNIYPIKDMKFVKDDRIFRTREEFANIPDEYFFGLRLAEQLMPVTDVEKYVLQRMELKAPKASILGAFMLESSKKAAEEWAFISEWPTAEEMEEYVFPHTD
jgi:hypothetical protein